MNGLRYVSLYEPSGYGESARRYLLGLASLGVPITWTPMVRGPEWGLGYQPFFGTSVGDPELDRFCNRRIDYDAVLLHLVPEYFPHWARIERKPKLSYTTWETERLPGPWPGLLHGAEMVMVPCQWNRQVFERCGVTAPVEVVPHCLPGELPPAAPIPTSGELVFYSVNVWSDRKALDLTLRAYGKAFRRGENVRLVLKTSPRHISYRVPFTGWSPLPARLCIAAERALRPRPPLTVLTDFVPGAEMDRLHASSHCYVSLCRSEGWGMGAFDAAAAGRPVIMTGFGGQLDFLPEELAYLVNYRLVDVRPRLTDRWGHGHHWAEPDVEHAAALMRHVYENRGEAREKGLQLSEFVRERFSADAICRRMIRCIDTCVPCLS